MIPVVQVGAMPVCLTFQRPSSPRKSPSPVSPGNCLSRMIHSCEGMSYVPRSSSLLLAYYASYRKRHDPLGVEVNTGKSSFWACFVVYNRVSLHQRACQIFLLPPFIVVCGTLQLDAAYFLSNAGSFLQHRPFYSWRILSLLFSPIV
jgi:hypothetical protein